MGQGRNYNNPAENDEDEKTSKIKKVTITEEESHHTDADEKEVPTPQSGDKPVSEREPEEDTATTDDDRYRASSG